jgi:hypothetical protein
MSAVLTVVALPTLRLVATLAWATIFLQVRPVGTVGFAMTWDGVQAGLVLVVVAAFVLVLVALVGLGVVLGVEDEALVLAVEIELVAVELLLALAVELELAVVELLTLAVLTLVLAVVATIVLEPLLTLVLVLEELVLAGVLVDIVVLVELVLEDPTEAATDPFTDPLPPDRPFAPVFKPLPVVPVPEPIPWGSLVDPSSVPSSTYPMQPSAIGSLFCGSMRSISSEPMPSASMTAWRVFSKWMSHAMP